MKRTMIILVLGALTALTAQGQQKSDTVIVSLGKTSKVIFTMEDRSDLEILKHYNFQDLFQDILSKIEKSNAVAGSDTAKTVSPQEEEQTPVTTEEPQEEKEESREEDWSSSRSSRDNNDRDHGDDDDDDNDNEQEWQKHINYRRGRIGKTWQSFNFDLGTNNFLSDGKFKDTLYSVRPWGSWYFAASTIQRTRAGRNFFLEWGLGISWYNFKFQNDDVMMQKTDDGVEFVTDTRDVNHIKSKLTVTYINASFVPVLDFGDHSRKPRMWDGYRSSFRIGLGPYVGYRIASRSKLVYSEDHNREKEKERDSFYLNNIRYGARLQLGFYGTDLFFNYDLNELFQENKGPKLNAFSFGVIF
jgi:hypothetical protein